MEQELKFIALVPTYEPDDKLPKIVNKLKENNFITIVINDGSDISYDNYFNECDTKIISYPSNRGKGFALKKGIEYVKNNFENYIIVTVDSDGQHRIEDVLNICEYAKNNRDTLVIGKRLRKENMPIRSRIGNIFTKYIFNLATKENIYDTQSGLRAFSEQLVDYMLEIKGDRFEYEMNVLLNLNKKNIKYKEIEIQTIYIDDNEKSHFRTFRDSSRVYGQILEYKARSVIPFLSDLLIFATLIITVNRLLITNVISKLLSTIIYYILNRKTIFKEKMETKTIIIHVLTIILNIVLSTSMIYIISKIINKYTSKVIVEILLVILIHEIKKRFKKTLTNG